ncbi:MAG: tRNA-dihydrouridine synthase family protein [Planctomycetes bacterium]|nr:tRNA-dihydrouridine synthase family protein [Planctomycetota bacterium]
MSVNLEPEEQAPRASREQAAEVARQFRMDPRIPATVPGFDAPFFQAGLAGYSDGAMRLVARRHGAPFCITEALLDRTLVNGGKGRRKEDPDLIASECGLGEVEDNQVAGLDDHPIAGQVMGTHPDEMAKAALILVKMGYDVIDVNLACPVKKIQKSNRGGHFLAHPREAIEVLKAVRQAVPASVPCTVKMRRAWDDTPEMAGNFEMVFDAAYEIGYAWAVVHARTVLQKYQGFARWEVLRDLVSRRPDRIVMGSGDVWSAWDIFHMLHLCGVHAVSVARGCIGNPWIFTQARDLMAGRTPRLPSLAEQREALLQHCQFAQTIHGERNAGRRMRKFGIKFAAHHPSELEVKNDFIQCETMEQWRSVIARHYGTAEDCAADAVVSSR